MSKRRVFDIDFPDETPNQEPVVEHRRGPMATAIGENAEALKERQEIVADIRAENDRLAHEHVRLKSAGLITDLVPLDAIRMTKLTRDRKGGRDEDLDDLKTSIRAVGLSNPIQVESLGSGVFELVQGYRRLMAFRELHEETGDEVYAKIPAGLSARGAELDLLYRRMVDENLVRRDISFAEMATLVRAYVDHPQIECDSVDQALNVLFGSVGRQKRSYIKHFVTLLDAIGSHLKFPEAIPRAMGLQLEKRISSEVGAKAKIRSALIAAMVTTPKAEVAVLSDLAQPPRKPNATQKSGKTLAKTTFRQSVGGGTVRCAAAEGRVELHADRDFSNVDRHKLEAAIVAFFEALESTE